MRFCFGLGFATPRHDPEIHLGLLPVTWSRIFMQHNFPILDDTGQDGSSVVSNWAKKCLETSQKLEAWLAPGEDCAQLSTFLSYFNVLRSGTAALQWTRKLSQGQAGQGGALAHPVVCCRSVESRGDEGNGSLSNDSGVWSSASERGAGVPRAPAKRGGRTSGRCTFLTRRHPVVVL